MSRSLLLIELLLPRLPADQPLISLVSDVGQGEGRRPDDDVVASSATGLGSPC